MKGLRISLMAAAVGLAALAMFCTIPAGAQQQTGAAPGKIEVVYIGPLTGPAAPWGFGTSRGGKYFLDQANAKGGVKVGGKTYTFDFIAYDHGLDPAKAVEYAKRAISSDKATLLVFQSTLCVIPMLPIATEAKVLNFHNSMGSKAMSPDYLYSFRLNFSGVTGETAPLAYAKEKLGSKTAITILADDDTGHEGLGEIQAAAETAGINLIGTEFFVRGTKDFYPILSRVLAKKPDILIYGQTSPGDCYLIIKQAYELGFKGIMTGSAPLDLAQLKKMVPDKALEQVVLVQAGAADLPGYTTPEQEEFKKAMIEKYGRDGKLFDTTIEDSWNECVWAPIYLQAIQKAGSLDPQRVTRTIETNFFSVLGRQVRFGGKKQFGVDRQILLDVPVMRIVNGTRTLVSVYKGVEAK